jgi:hypothetical protein
MKKNVLLIILTIIMLSVALYGKWVDAKIIEHSEDLVKNNLDPQPWLSRSFDYYGTPIQSNFTGVYDSSKVVNNIKAIEDFRIVRDTVWAKYLKCEMSAEEKTLVDRVNLEVKIADALVDPLIQSVKEGKNLKMVDSIVRSGEVDKVINPAMDDINLLIDLQSKEGADIIKTMQDTLKTFSSFMIGVLALAFVLLGTLIVDFIKQKKLESKPVRRVRKTTKKAPVKKTVTKKQ